MKDVIENEKQSSKLSQNEVKKLRTIIENNNRVKEKWKELIYELTRKLEKKITELIVENQELKKSRRIV
jgi:DNA topoisomerase VI subunit A